ncbi:hypothetical protein, partial [Deinococcus wulumuqiensis]|uniref:hypothetical protein n=1 Tax=Deinococcus wulumuqiensis TaxID=980427 RepID=UPI00242C445F
RGRPSVAAAAEASSGEKRGRGRPRKVAGAEPARSIPQASSEADAIRKLEALQLERARAEKMVGLFEESN